MVTGHGSRLTAHGSRTLTGRDIAGAAVRHLGPHALHRAQREVQARGALVLSGHALLARVEGATVVLVRENAVLALANGVHARNGVLCTTERPVVSRPGRARIHDVQARDTLSRVESAVCFSRHGRIYYELHFY